MAGNNRSPNRKSFMAIYELERLGIEPISYLKEVYDESMASYRSMRGLTEKGDAGPAYLSNALGAAKALASFKYPTLSAMAVKDVTELDPKNAKPMNTKEAIEVIKQDPFCSPHIKALDTSLLPDKEEDVLLPIGVKIEQD